ncbi:hypothetical protein D7X33_01420 [Butyricicoccus sp. 1XD8-22]|nr:hypothetical protein D7X33_01420 [Butyricicoccus sp. 1XD8-22]
MKKIIPFLSAAFLMSSFVFTEAANTPSIMCADDGDALVYHIDSAEEAIIELPANTAVIIIDENGFTTVYEYAVETGIARDGSRRASVTRTATSRTLGDVAGNATLIYVIGYFILFFTFFLDRCSTECYNQFA